LHGRLLFHGFQAVRRKHVEAGKDDVRKREAIGGRAGRRPVLRLRARTARRQNEHS